MCVCVCVWGVLMWAFLLVLTVCWQVRLTIRHQISALELASSAVILQPNIIAAEIILVFFNVKMYKCHVSNRETFYFYRALLFLPEIQKYSSFFFTLKQTIITYYLFIYVHLFHEYL